MKKNILYKRLSYITLILTLLTGSINQVKAQEGYIGEIRMFAGNFAPRDWAFCDGSLLPIANNTALFSILGTTYGGDGRTTFALPDLRSRIAVHPGTGPGLSTYRLGEKAGSEQIVLNNTQLPTHTHSAILSNGTATIKASSAIGTSSVPGQGGATTLAATGTGRSGGSLLYNSTTPDIPLKTGETENNVSGSITVSNAGASQPVSIVQPVLGMNYIICVYGIFPSRN